MRIFNAIYMCCVGVCVPLFTACSGKVASELESGSAEVINIDDARQQETMTFSSIFEAPQVVVLETNDSCVIRSIYSMEVYKDNLYILDDVAQALYVFDKKGNFLHRIGHRGRGHDEYVELSDFSIDRDNGIVYLWDEAKDKALKYNIATGKFMPGIKTERNGLRCFCMQYHGGNIYVNRASMDAEPGNYMLKEINAETGEQTDSLLTADEYNKGWNSQLRLQHSFFYSRNTDAPKFIGMFSDKIAAITDNVVETAYIVKSKDLATPDEVKKMLDDYIKNSGKYDFSVLNDKKRISRFSWFVEFDSLVSFQYSVGDDIGYLLYDRKTKETTVYRQMVNDYIYGKNNIPTNLCYADEKGVWALLRQDNIPYFIKNIVSTGKLDKNIDQYDKLKQLTNDSNKRKMIYRVLSCYRAGQWGSLAQIARIGSAEYCRFRGVTACLCSFLFGLS